MQLVH